MVRLRDVAERAGVSVKTVSNVVHGYAHVRPETRARVEAALEELRYRPNLSARTLRKGRSGVVALALPALDMPYFADLASAVVAAASDRGWTVLVDQTDGVRARELEIAGGLSGHLIDGLIMSPIALDSDDLRHAGRDIPMVLLGERVADGPADHIAVDNVAAAAAATGHLVSLGRRRIAAVGYQDPEHSASGVATLRRQGFEKALAEAGLEAPVGLAPHVHGYRRADGAAAMGLLLDCDDPPDAVFCFNDLLALGALRAIADRGYRVPEDVAVIGFDDIDDCRYSVPTLSSVAPDKAALARTAVRLLEQRISGSEDVPARDLRIGFEVVARESTLGRP